MKNVKSFLSTAKSKILELFTKTTRPFKTIFAIGCLALSSNAFAAAGNLDSAADTLLDIITGKPLKVVLIIAVIVCFGVIAWGQSQGEGGMFKKVLPVIIGCIGVASASGIVTTFVGDGKIKESGMAEQPAPIIYEVNQNITCG